MCAPAECAQEFVLETDAVMEENGNADIHDVMTAMAKAELGVTVATNITTKVIQAYEKITQIQL